jgi:hypothetical protein
VKTGAARPDRPASSWKAPGSIVGLAGWVELQLGDSRHVVVGRQEDDMVDVIVGNELQQLVALGSIASPP